AQEVESINQAVRSAEAGLLNLDRLTEDEVAAPAALLSPVTMPELERTLVGSAALHDQSRVREAIITVVVPTLSPGRCVVWPCPESRTPLPQHGWLLACRWDCRRRPCSRWWSGHHLLG